ncbi:MAG: UDP-N-acetylmuramoylalanyl-D-glutamyl-2, 6-diaminopimelate--D-alanyl-D-alanine ligase [Magnetovibrio sp.]|nr:UDP-N-acetylmuramoylalanyl-D-glutamyl-2, 6-diaminopimelate--D-alanyl-D-alanine ligase [Magnetovibrio sp.]|tara:strand:- start:3695 stop:5095 length:1401 start_codon:yes stop_codon:yes gene_type:complete
MKPLWTSAQVEYVTQGQSSSDWIANGVSIDSRTIEHGDLFVALHGPNYDGHDFVSDALSKGAAAAVVDKTREGSTLKVGDTMKALQSLGLAARKRTEATIIAVTGSVGKTGSKDAICFALSRQACTFANKGSLNNHWGVPLSLSRMPPKTTYGIFELGMNHPGEIYSLSKMVRPHVALITTVEAVHKEFFDSVEAIADAKAEIFAGLESNGVVVLNYDNKYFYQLAAAAQAIGITNIISFGAGGDADFRLLDAKPYENGTLIQADLGGEFHTYSLSVAGRHWVINSLGVIAAIAAAGGDFKAAAVALGEMKAGKGRGEFRVLRTKKGTFTLIDESYNASPVSMKAAIEVLGGVKPVKGGRRIAVLGDMLELGQESAQFHADLADVLKRESVDLVFTAGDQMVNLATALGSKLSAGHVKRMSMLKATVLETIQPGDVVLVKASAASNAGIIVNSLLALNQKYSVSEF